MVEKDSIEKNMNSSARFVLIGNGTAAALFFVAWIYLRNVWLLTLAIVVAVAAIVFAVVSKYIARSFVKKTEPK
ncbi:MAG: hypothetical protein ACM3U1_10590 [Chloroflexota bacterium]